MSEVSLALSWALGQNFQSVASRHAKTLAQEVERLRDWQRRAVGHLLTLEDIGDAYGMESAEVTALIAEVRVADQQGESQGAAHACPWCGARVREDDDCPRPAVYCSHD